MNKFYFTFGQKYGTDEVHPAGGHKDGWFTVIAENSVYARDKMVELCGTKWSNQYQDQPDIATYPRGELRVIE